MKRVEHTHASKGSKITFKKVVLWLFLFWLGSTVLSLLLFSSNKRYVAVLFLVGCAFVGWKLFKRFKKAEIPSVLKNVIPQNQKPQTEALNLKLNGAVDIQNPYAGVFVSGGAGAGKSKSIIEPLIADCGRKGFTGVVYDFKFPELASYVNTAYQNTVIKPYFINFTDLSRSNRINPIAPELMKNESFAREFAYAILVNLDPNLPKASNRFWGDNATSILTATFWYLREVYPEFCTLPHAMSMIFEDKEKLVRTLSSVPKCKDMLSTLSEAMENGSGDLVSSVLGTLRTLIQKINTDEVYYLLTESDFDLALNNPENKGMLVLGNNPVLSEAYSPIIGLILTSISKQLNQQGKEKSVFMVDEFPTVYIPNVEQLPATARSNKVATILACQDIAQMVDKYGKDKTDTILSNLGNQFYGRTTNPATAQRVSQMFGKADKLMKTDTKNYETSLIGSLKKGTGESFSYQERDLVKVQDVATLPTGSFYTILSEGKERQGLSSIPMDKAFQKTEIMPFKSVSQWDLDQAFKKVKQDVQYILGS